MNHQVNASHTVDLHTREGLKLEKKREGLKLGNKT